MKTFTTMVFLLGLCGLAGCAGDDSSIEQAQDAPDMPQQAEVLPDMGEPDAEAESDAEACEPLVANETCRDQCGLQDDGCGGSIDCGVCECVGGDPAEPMCGPCGLGVARCTEAGELECVDDLRVDPTSCESAVVYFRQSDAAEGTGHLEDPFTSWELVEDALNTRADIAAVVIAASPRIAHQLTVYDGVSILGGFDSEFAPDVSMRARFEPRVNADTPCRNVRCARGDVCHKGTCVAVPECPDGGLHTDHQLGLRAVDITASTLVRGIDVYAPDGSQGQSSYGAVAKNAEGLTLKSVTIHAGQGGDGAEGADGRDGMFGQDGGDGQPGFVTGSGVNASRGGGAPGHVRQSSDARRTCAYDSRVAAGRGGTGEWRWSDQSTLPASPGKDSETATGGEALRFNGDIGGAGASGRAGRDGAAPESSPFCISNAQTLLMRGRGEDGEHGQNGGGGAGGGGAKSTIDCGGVSGGGGGSGGCGGEAGMGGLPGGASVGLLLQDESAPSLIQTIISTAEPGQGGPGGVGGRGAGGGKGGAWAGVCETGEQVWTSGPGGRGGDGGEGGDGAPGRDGFAESVVCLVPTVLETDVERTSVTSSCTQQLTEGMQ